MAHIEDRWMRPVVPNRLDGRKQLVKEKTERYGSGLRWLAQWTESGQRKSKSFATADAARAHLARIAKAKEEGTHVRTNRITFGQYGDEWIAAQLHHRQSTREQVEIRWRLNIKPALGHMRLRDVERRHVQSAVNQWQRGTDIAGPLAPATVKLAYTYAVAIFKAAVTDRLIPVSPCVDINLPEIDNATVIPLTIDQVRHIATTISPKYEGMVWLASATGMRSGELRGLTLNRLTLKDILVIRVDRQLVSHRPLTLAKPKTDNSYRNISVDDMSAGRLARHMCQYPPGPEGLIFTGRFGGPIARATAASAWNAAVEGMGLPDRSGWHMLRHFHASMLIAAGLSPTAVAARLGHKDANETLTTYAHLWPNDEERARDAVLRGLWATDPG